MIGKYRVYYTPSGYTRIITGRELTSAGYCNGISILDVDRFITGLTETRIDAMALLK
jgi:hypothetical protein